MYHKHDSLIFLSDLEDPRYLHDAYQDKSRGDKCDGQRKGLAHDSTC